MMFSTLQSWQHTPSLVPTPSFNLLSFVGDKNAPCVDGLDTKSNAISSKSGWTSTVSSSDNSFTEPKPLDDIPSLIPDLNNSFKMLP